MSDADRFDVEISRSAEADLKEIAAYLTEQDSPTTASEFINSLMDRIDTLEQFPARGSMPKELEVVGRRNYRQLLLGQHRIIYQIVGKRVVVVLVAHGRRDMQALLPQRLLNR